jgi:hypothetical protein
MAMLSDREGSGGRIRGSSSEDGKDERHGAVFTVRAYTIGRTELTGITQGG